MPTQAHKTLTAQAEHLGRLLCAQGLCCATAESCTGGLVGAACTRVSGASQWFMGGIIAYDNRVKTSLLGVPPALLATHGAVSEAVVLRMAEGACAALQVATAMALSGVAGPTGGTQEKPVGTVWLGLACKGHYSAHCLHLQGDRDAIRQAAVHAALSGLSALLEKEQG